MSFSHTSSHHSSQSHSQSHTHAPTSATGSTTWDAAALSMHSSSHHSPNMIGSGGPSGSIGGIGMGISGIHSGGIGGSSSAAMTQHNSAMLSGGEEDGSQSELSEYEQDGLSESVSQRHSQLQSSPKHGNRGTKHRNQNKKHHHSHHHNDNTISPSDSISLPLDGDPDSSLSAKTTPAAKKSGLLDCTPRKLQMPPKHQPWGSGYEHPVRVTTRGKMMEKERSKARREWEEESRESGTATSRNARSRSPSPNRKQKGSRSQRKSENSNDGDDSASDTSPSRHQQQPHQPYRTISSFSPDPSSLFLSLSSLSPSASPSQPDPSSTSAFTSTARYQKIMHPPTRPHEVLREKLLAEGGGGVDIGALNTTTSSSLQIPPWHHTTKLPPPRPGAGMTDIFNDINSKSPRGFSRGGRSPSRGGNGMENGDPFPPRPKTSHGSSGGGDLSSSPSPSPPSSSIITASNSGPSTSRSRREVLSLLSAFRHAPRGTDLLLREQRHRDAEREMQAAKAWYKQTGEITEMLEYGKVVYLKKERRKEEKWGEKILQQQQQQAGQQNSNNNNNPHIRLASAPSSQQSHSQHLHQQQRPSTSQATGFISLRSMLSSRGGGGGGGGSQMSTSHGDRSYRSGMHALARESGFLGSGSSQQAAAAEPRMTSISHPHTRSTATSNAASLSLSSPVLFHRLHPPSFMNVPEWTGEATGVVTGGYTGKTQSGSKTARRASSPMRSMKKTVVDEEKDSYQQQRPATSSSSSFPLTDPSNSSLLLQSIRDYTVRALACNRAGRRAAEANAWYCVGVLRENGREYVEAREAYGKFKEIIEGKAKRGKKHLQQQQQQSTDSSLHPSSLTSISEDSFALSLAYNALGCCSTLLGDSESAVKYHSLHRDVSDSAGKFLAHTNLGLVYQMRARETDGNGSNDTTASSSATTLAATHHQHALRYSISIGSLTCQNISILNLGLTGLQHNDLQTAKICMERGLVLSENLEDKKSMILALHTLGVITSRLGEYELSIQYYTRAQYLASASMNGGGGGGDMNNDPSASSSTSHQSIYDQLRVQVGIAKANQRMKEEMTRMAHVMCRGTGTENSSRLRLKQQTMREEEEEEEKRHAEDREFEEKIAARDSAARDHAEQQDEAVFE